MPNVAQWYIAFYAISDIITYHCFVCFKGRDTYQKVGAHYNCKIFVHVEQNVHNAMLTFTLMNDLNFTI